MLGNPISTDLSVAVVGHRGLIGSAIAEHLQSLGISVVAVERALIPEHDEGLVDSLDHANLAEGAQRLVDDLEPNEFSELSKAITRCTVVVNAAGAAQPDAGSIETLLKPNVILPLILQRACAESRVTKHLVHLSSAAVQGASSVLDETSRVDPVSPYSESKAFAEQALLTSSYVDQVLTTIYRPTSVQGAGRKTSAALRRATRNRLMPQLGHGEKPLPLTSVSAVARAVAVLAQSDTGGIVLHPWEGVTQKLLLEAARPQSRRLVIASFFEKPLQRLLNLGVSAGGSFAGRFRRVELLMFGQQVSASRLHELGYKNETVESVLLSIGLSDEPQ